MQLRVGFLEPAAPPGYDGSKCRRVEAKKCRAGSAELDWSTFCTILSYGIWLELS
jgi:hypothetical protein